MGIYSRGRPQRRRTPTTIAELEAAIAQDTATQARLAETAERQAAVAHALATGDVGLIRAWARAWLPDTSTIDAADDASLLESARAVDAIARAPRSDRERLDELDGAAAAVAAQIAAQPPAVAERLIRALETSQAPDPLRRALDRLIALQARRLRTSPKGLFA